MDSPYPINSYLVKLVDRDDYRAYENYKVFSKEEFEKEYTKFESKPFPQVYKPNKIYSHTLKKDFDLWKLEVEIYGKIKIYNYKIGQRFQMITYRNLCEDVEQVRLFTAPIAYSVYYDTVKGEFDYE